MITCANVDIVINVFSILLHYKKTIMAKSKDTKKETKKKPEKTKKEKKAEKRDKKGK